MPEENSKEKLWILVKAYPQPSLKYQETVCCAGITEDGRLLRLYPIRYRHLKKEQQFDRFDLLEVKIRKSNQEKDKRPESYKVDEDSIVILKKGKHASTASKSELWKPFISDSLSTLIEQQKICKKSLGIIKPDGNSLKFKAKSVKDEDADTKSLVESSYGQANLFEKNLTPFERPEYVFYYNFRSNGKEHSMQIHDWEVQATYRNYKKKYGYHALDKMNDFYNNRLLDQNPHFIMGNMMRRPWQFMIIGILRSSATPRQKSFFDL